jgi:hypothetical protein
MVRAPSRRRSASRTRRSKPTSSRAPTTAATTVFAAFIARASSTRSCPGSRRRAVTGHSCRGPTPMTPATGVPDCAQRPTTASSTRCSPQADGPGAGRAPGDPQRREASQPVPGVAHPLRRAGRARDARAHRPCGARRPGARLSRPARAPSRRLGATGAGRARAATRARRAAATGRARTGGSLGGLHAGGDRRSSVSLRLAQRRGDVTDATALRPAGASSILVAVSRSRLPSTRSHSRCS